MMKIKHGFPFFFFLFTCILTHAGPGDTIVVQTIDHNTPVNPGWNSPREGKYLFPPDSISFEKILMHYTLQCDPGQNPACGEWDYTTHTYLHFHTGEYDSNLFSHPNFIVNGITPDSLPYMNQASWQYYPRKQYANATIPSLASQMGTGTLLRPLTSEASTDGKAQYLFLADELATAGFAAGDFTGLRLHIDEAGGPVRNFKVRMKLSPEEFLIPENTSDSGLVTVFSSNIDFSPAGWHTIPFAFPLAWDGTSNVIIEFSYAWQDPGAGNTTVFADPVTYDASVASFTPDNFLDFEGTDYIDVPVDAIESLDSAVTVCFWQYGDPAFQPQNDVLFAAVDSAGNRILNVHLPWSDGRVYWDAGYEDGYDRIYNNTPDPSYYEGRWNHWAFVKDVRSGEMMIYYNGELFSYGWGRNKPLGGITAFRIGAYPTGDNFYDGMVDEFQVWNTALSDSLIIAWMNRPVDASHPDYQNLITYFPFNEGSGLVTQDESQTAVTATLFGYPAWRDYQGAGRFIGFQPLDHRPQLVLEQGTYDPSQLDSLIVVDSLAYGRLMVTLFEDSLQATTPTDTLSVWPSYYDNYSYDPQGNPLDSSFVDPDETLYRVDWPYYGPPFEITEPYELGRYITPYGIGLDLGDGWTWVYDVTDFRPFLADSVHLTAGNFQELLDLKFIMVEGTPPREVVRIDKMWHGYYSLSNFDNLVLPDTIALPPGASSFKLKITTSGHEWDNPTNCAEFCQKDHWVDVDGVTRFNWEILDVCSTNPLYPQGGTWIYDRAGWCPGAKVTERHMELTPFIAGDTVILDYNCDSDPYGSYIVTSYLFSYTEPSFGLDASVTEIMAPNNDEFYGRVDPADYPYFFNPICGKPMIRIRNNGSDTLTSLLISYFPEGGVEQTFQWLGSLAFMETAEVSLEPIDWTGWVSGNDIFFVTVSEPNGGEDEYPLNNTMQSSFSLAPEYPNEFIVRLKTNKAAYQNHWEITDPEGNIVVERDGFDNETIYNDTVYLDDGCYTFTLHDTGDDGISFWANSSGNGSLGFRRIDGTFLAYFDPDFGRFTSRNFTVGMAVSERELNREYAVQVYPNPSKGVFTAAFDLDGSQETDVRVFDQAGRVIFSKREKALEQGKMKIDLSGHADGIYYLTVRHGEGYFSKKLVISR